MVCGSPAIVSLLPTFGYVSDDKPYDALIKYRLCMPRAALAAKLMVVLYKIGFPENETSMVRRWLRDLEPVNYLENLGHIDHCACFPRTQSQRTYVEGEILRIRGDCRPRRPRRLGRWD